MSIILSDQEKFSIVNQHIKNCITNIYNLQMSLIAEMALSEPNQTLIDNLNNQIQQESLKQTALEGELSSLNIGN